MVETLEANPSSGLTGQAFLLMDQCRQSNQPAPAELPGPQHVVSQGEVPHPPLLRAATFKKPPKHFFLVNSVVGLAITVSLISWPAGSAAPDTSRSNPAAAGSEHGKLVAAELKMADGTKPGQRPGKISGAKQSAWRRAVTEARTAMSQRNMQAARSLVSAAVNHAQTSAEKTEATRLKAILTYLVQFWDMVRGGMANFEIAEEIAIKDTRVIVVDASANELTIRSEGVNQKYRLQSLPGALAMAIVEQKIPSSTSRNVACGAFLAMDQEGDRKQARRLWKAAMSAGADISGLLAEVKDTSPTKRKSSVSRKSVPPSATPTANP